MIRFHVLYVEVLVTFFTLPVLFLVNLLLHVFRELADVQVLFFSGKYVGIYSRFLSYVIIKDKFFSFFLDFRRVKSFVFV